MEIGFIGLGHIGFPVARRLIQANHRVVAFDTRAEALDTTYLKAGGGPLALAGDQLWLRQSDHGLSPQGIAIIHAHGVELHGKQLSANDVSVFRLDGRDREA